MPAKQNIVLEKQGSSIDPLSSHFAEASLPRRDFLKIGLAAAGAAGLSSEAFGKESRQPRQITLQIGNKMPDIELPNLKGDKVKLSASFGEKLVLVDFWASWCRPCLLENPKIVSAYNKYKDFNFKDPKSGKSIGKGFDVVGISLDDDLNAWKSAIERGGLSWKQHLITGGWEPASRVFGVTSIPANFLVDKSGTIVGKNLVGHATLGTALRMRMSRDKAS